MRAVPWTWAATNKPHGRKESRGEESGGGDVGCLQKDKKKEKKTLLPSVRSHRAGTTGTTHRLPSSPTSLSTMARYDNRINMAAASEPNIASLLCDGNLKRQISTRPAGRTSPEVGGQELDGNN